MEKRRANTYAAALIVLIIATALIRIWAADREASCVGPSAIRTDQNGNVYLISANILYVHDKDGDLVERIPLEKFGVDQFIGDFWIFKNGDILVRRGTRQRPSFLREIQMFLRIGSGKQDSIDEENGILQRCNPATLRCEQFGSDRDAFRKMTTFKIAVDEEKGNVYISDTLEHRLLLYDMQGKLQRTSEASFNFPNGILPAEDGLLYVADTNHHRICGVSTEHDSFGRIEKEFSILTSATAGGRTWPSALLLADNERWWVINSGNDMRHGDVMTYDRKGQFMKRIDLPDDADPMALAVSGDRILITDPTRMSVYCLDQDGRMGEDFGSLLMNVEFHELRRTRLVYTAYKHASLGILVGLLILTVAVVVKSRQGKKANEAHQDMPLPAARRTAGPARARSDDLLDQVWSTTHAEDGQGTQGLASGSRGTEAPTRELPEQPRELALKFHGSAREYFRIWIVNLCLTILTLGIFSAWAKVRKKRYFYSHTTLDNTPFQYLGQPVPIFKGRVIAAIAFSAYYLSSHFFTSLLPYVLAAGLVLAPWVVVRSAAFNARYSAFRNMTFQFKGRYQDALKVIYLWGLVPLLVIGTIFSWWGMPAVGGVLFLIFGVAFPWWIRRLKNLIISQTSYGGLEGTFSATGGQFFKVYSRAGLITVGVAIVSGILVAVLAASATRNPQVLLPLFAVPFYAGYVFAYAYMQAQSGNLVWNHTRLGPLRFQSTLLGRGMAKLYLGNALGIIASLGLLTPWAVMRTLKYRADNLRVLREGDLADFQGSETGVVQAIGAETMDFFDVDLSL